MPKKMSSRCNKWKELQTSLVRESAVSTYAYFPEIGPLLALLPFFARLLSYDEGKQGAEDGKQYKMEANERLKEL
jgi:hypothetical protein